MHSRIIKLIIAALPFVYSEYGFAQATENAAAIIGATNLSIRQTTGNSGGNVTNYLMDLRGGYRNESGWYFGMIYSRQFANGDNATNQSAVGNSLGYYFGKVSLIGSYYLTARQDEASTTGTVRRTEGSGFQLDLSVMFPIWSPRLTFGPTLTYKSMTFLKQEGPNNTYINDKHTETYIYPYITLAFAY